MAFQSLVEEAQSAVEKKRQRKGPSKLSSKNSIIKIVGTVDSTKACVMLMERATQLQQGGMSSF